MKSPARFLRRGFLLTLVGFLTVPIGTTARTGGMGITYRRGLRVRLRIWLWNRRLLRRHGSTISGCTRVVRCGVALREREAGRPEKNTQNCTRREKMFSHATPQIETIDVDGARRCGCSFRTVTLPNMSQCT
jgi:hypothetical protein